MGWKKRPTTITTEKESTRAVFHLGILAYDEWEATQRAAYSEGIEEVDRILTGDLNYT